MFRKLATRPQTWVVPSHQEFSERKRVQQTLLLAFPNVTSSGIVQPGFTESFFSMDLVIL